MRVKFSRSLDRCAFVGQARTYGPSLGMRARYRGQRPQGSGCRKVLEIAHQGVDRAGARAETNIDTPPGKGIAVRLGDEATHKPVQAAGENELANRFGRPVGILAELAHLAAGVDDEKAVGFCKERTENRLPPCARDEQSDAALSICRRRGYR